MKSGAPGKGKTIAVAVLLAIGIVALGWVLWPRPESAAPTAGPAGTAAPATKSRTRRPVRPKNVRYAVELDAVDPTIHLELLANAEEVSYRGRGRNIFESTAEEVAHQVKPPVKIDPCAVTPDAPQCQTGPPPPPPIDLKFYGFASKPGEAKKIFLSRGDDIFVAKEGDIVNRRYRIVKIGVTSVQIEDVSNNNIQTIPLTQG